MSPDTPAKLLVPLDGSIPADGPLEIAQVIASWTAAEVHVLVVADEPLSDDAIAARALIPDGWRPRVRLHAARGDPARAITHVASEIAANAILISSHGATRDLQVPAGHVTLAVLEAPPCPVYVVRSALSMHGQAHRLHCLRRIMVPLDGTSEAAQSIEYASALALNANARLLMLHVLPDRPELARATVAPRYADQSHYEFEAWEDEFIRSSFARSARPPEVRAEVCLCSGDPGVEIARFAREEDCDLIVAAWGGRLSPGRAHVVRTLLREAVCPILLLRARASGAG